jgi:hypothetical protein
MTAFENYFENFSQDNFEKSKIIKFENSLNKNNLINKPQTKPLKDFLFQYNLLEQTNAKEPLSSHLES